MQTRSNKPKKFWDISFYILVASLASLILLTLSYAVLRLNSSLGLLYSHNSSQYFFTYLALTISTAICFGINASLFVYQARRYGVRNLFHQGGSGLGAVIGLVASSCPVCGSTILSLVGVLGGLSVLPFQGLELKLLSLVIVLLSVLYSLVLLRRQNNCSDSCPTPKRVPQLKYENFLMTFGLAVLVIMLVNWQLLRTDSVFMRNSLHAALTCGTSQKL